MQAAPPSTLDLILDRYFLSPEEMSETKVMVQKLGIESGIEKIGSVLSLNPKHNSTQQAMLGKLDVSGFAFDLAQTILPKINKVQDPSEKKRAAGKLGEIVQYSGLDIWESVKEYKPDFIKEFLVGFKRFKAKTGIDNKDFFTSMGAGYFHRLHTEFNTSSTSNSSTPTMFLAAPEPIVLRDSRRIDFNKDHQYGRRSIRFFRQISQEYGYVKDIRTIKGFFNSEDQFGSRVVCYGTKRNHIALLFDWMLKEEILVLTGGKGHWKVMEACFVDESGNPLSKSFSKLLSKLYREEGQKDAIFSELSAFMEDFKK